MTQNLKQMLTIAAIVSFCSMFFVNFFIEGFIVTISVIILPILIYWYKPKKIWQLGIVVGICSPLFRMITLMLSERTLGEAALTIWPEIFFYVFYGLMFEVFYARKSGKTIEFATATFLGDYLSNLVEISLRLGSLVIPFKYIQGLALIAITRTIIVLFIVILIKKFRTFTMKQAHEEHYKNLILLTSNFWSEIYFMEKNMVYIETLMVKAFGMYHKTKVLDLEPEVVELSLEIAKEVHEVKKDYIRVIQGLQGITEKKLFDLEMGIDEIVKIVVDNTRTCLELNDKRIHIVDRINSNAPVKFHFYMTSVIRNLIGNAVEAMENQPVGMLEVDVLEKGDRIIITVSDNGEGIKERDLPYIFNPGFSSKYVDETGESKRGVGLSVVKSIVEQVFNGSIDVHTKESEGTRFTLVMNKPVLKGDI